MKFCKSVFLVCASLLSLDRAVADRIFTDSTELKRVQQICIDLKKEFAPDSRTALFSLITDKSEYRVETTEKAAADNFSSILKAENIRIPINIVVYPAKELGENTQALVNLSVVNLRANPRNSAELATQALLGTPLDILKKEGYYYLVRTPDQYIAWLDAGAITILNQKTINDWKSKQKLIFTNDYGHGLAQPKDKSERISDLVMGDILVKLGKSKGYYHVQYPDARTAYVPVTQMADYTTWSAKNSPKPEAVIDIAKTMMGVPYLWGGTSVKGVDCSGFTKTAFFMNGVVIPRDASQQALAGEDIPVLTNGHFDIALANKNLLPGDLLFFASGRDQDPNARVTHVAMYIGKGQFIHSSGKVRINSMLPDSPDYDDFQTRTIVKARRYFGQIGTPGISYLSQNPAYLVK